MLNVNERNQNKPMGRPGQKKGREQSEEEGTNTSRPGRLSDMSPYTNPVLAGLGPEALCPLIGPAFGLSKMLFGWA